MGPTRVLDHTSPVGWLVVRPAVRVEPEATLAEAAQLMIRADVSALLVGAARGAILTERDLARSIAAGCSDTAVVGDVATYPALVTDGSMPIADAAALMLNSGVRHLVVGLDDGDEGVVSMRVIAAVLVSLVNRGLWLRSLRWSVSSAS